MIISIIEINVKQLQKCLSTKRAKTATTTMEIKNQLKTNKQLITYKRSNRLQTR